DFKLWIQRPRQHFQVLCRYVLRFDNVLRRAAAWRQHQVGALQALTSHPGEWLPNLDAMGAHDAFEPPRDELHPRSHRCQVGMRRDHQFGASPSGTERRCREACLGSRTPGEYKFAGADGHAVKLGRIVQAEEPALHFSVVCEFSKDCGEMPSGALYAAGCVQLREEANQHARSLPSAALDGKPSRSSVPVHRCSFLVEGVSLTLRNPRSTVRRILLSVFLLCPLPILAQSSCPPLQSPRIDSSKILFTARQESELGEIVRQQFESEF